MMVKAQSLRFRSPLPISRLQRFQESGSSTQGVALAITFRAFGAKTQVLALVNYLRSETQLRSYDRFTSLG
jgi:hypothetical protein